MINARSNRNPRNPVRKRDGALILCQPGEHLHEYLLGEVLLGNTAWQVRAHDANNQRVKMVDELPCSCLIALADPNQAASQIERQDVVVRHGRMEASTCTSGKTSVAPPGYQRNTREEAALDF